MLQLGNIVLQFVQIVCLDLQVLINLVRFLLKHAVLLSDLLKIEFVTLVFSLQVCLSFLFSLVKELRCPFSLLYKRLHLTDELFSFRDNLVEELQLMAVSELEVTIDAYGVDISIGFAQPSFDLAISTNRKSAHAAVMALVHELIESHGTCLTTVSFIELTLLNNLELHGQILKVLALQQSSIQSKSHLI